MAQSSSSKHKTSSALNSAGPPQLELILASHNPFWQSSLFSEVYLQNDVPTKYKEMWEQDESGPFFIFCNQFRNLCTELADEDLDSWSERNTINKFIKPILRMLGYFDKCSANQEPWTEDEPFSIKENGELKTYKPDLIIVNDPKELKYIVRKKSDEKLEEARTSVIVPIEAKYWDRIEDLRKNSSEDSKRSDKKDQSDATRTLDFDEQCLKYMDILNKDYGILTDGKTWRLYNKDLSSDSYRRHFQFNLGHLMKHVNAGLDKDPRDYEIFLESAKYFFYFFSKQALYSETGERRFLDDLLEYSKKYVTQVENDLKGRFVQAMAFACNGYSRSIKSEREQGDLSMIRNVAESHLFNILFIKHCEARNILPLKQSPEYRKISLSNTVDKLEYFNPEKEDDGLNHPMLTRMFAKDFRYDSKGTELYDRLLKLTKIVQEGSKTIDSEFEISGFRESLFSTNEWAFAQKYKLSNADMVQVLFELGYCESHVPGRRYQQIPYNFFSPRQLGSIYESFLEFKLAKADEDMIYAKGQWQKANLKSEKIKHLDVPKVRKSELYFTPDNRERKATGSYYTPDYIVQDIVKRVLAPLLKDCTSKSLLELRIIDPAMGSAHFLNGALNYLAKRYLELVSQETNDDLDMSLPDAKRIILPKCIVGIDINPRAVKLAKMSLWLESAVPGKPLEDLDDQLIVADSIFEKHVLKRLKGIIDPKGLTVVVGNPPYGIDFSEDQVIELFNRFTTLHQKHDSFHIFLERVLMDKEWLDHCNIQNYRVGFIVPDGIIGLDCFKKFRRALIDHKVDISFVVNKYPVFDDAHVNTLILIANSIGKKASVGIASSENPSDLSSLDLVEIPIEAIESDPLCRMILKADTPLNEFKNTIDDFFEATAGAQAYEVGKGTPKQTRKMLDDKVYNSDRKIKKGYRPYLYGNDIRQMYKSWRNEEYVLYGANLSAPRDPKFHEGSRVVVQRIRNPSLKQRIIAAHIDDDSVSSVGLSVLKPKKELESKVSARALAVYINLPTINTWFSEVNKDVNVKPTVLKTIPVDLALIAKGSALEKEHRELEKIAARDGSDELVKEHLARIDALVFPKKKARKAA